MAGMGCARLLLSHWHPLLLLPLDDICLEAQEDQDPRRQKQKGGQKIELDKHGLQIACVMLYYIYCFAIDVLLVNMVTLLLKCQK